MTDTKETFEELAVRRYRRQLAQTRAYGKAMRRLREARREDFDLLYAEELTKAFREDGLD